MKIQVVHKKQEDGSVSHHARIRGGNGEIVWVTETYERSSSAFEAVGLLRGLFAGGGGGGGGAATASAVVLDSDPEVEEVWE